MITLITGAPGAGKSSALVSLLGALAKDRTIYVDGVPDLKVEHKLLEKPHDWPQDVPDGSAIVIDEVQRIWPTRGPGQRPSADITALETHRHRGLDFFLVTQHPRMLDPHVKSLCGRHVHLRDIGIMGRWWYEWPECANDPTNAWKTAPLKKRYRLDKATFALYKSASVHIKPIRSFPIMLLVLGAAVLVVGAGAFMAMRNIKDKMNPASTSTAVAPGGALVPGAANPFGPAPAAAPAKPAKVPEDEFVAYIPRIAHRPETAPAYDDLRKVVAMPVVVSSMCINDVCRCFTDQGTQVTMTPAQCSQWAANPPFNPYKVVQQQQQPATAQQGVVNESRGGYVKASAL